MLTIIDREGKKYVSFVEFYDTMGFNVGKYHRFVKRNITHQQESIPVEGLDYIPVSKKQVGQGKKRKDYHISVEFLKTLCFTIATIQSSKVKHWADKL